MDHLAGLRIISFNHFLMGPMGVQFLADLGAEVIAIEPIEGGYQRKWRGGDRDVDGQTTLQLMGNRNKRSCALDLKHPDGLAIARQLIASADIVTENFRPGVMDKLGLGYEELRKTQPKLIYAAASGFGPDGPYAQRAGQDLIIQALSGLAAINGPAETGARAIGVPAADHHGAALFAAGILAAIVRRERTGQGGRVDVNLLSAALDLQMESIVTFLNGDRTVDTRPEQCIATWYHEAPYGVYPTQDGFVAVSVAPLDVLSAVLDIPESERIPLDQAYARRAEASLQIARAMRKRPTAAWVEAFTARGIWHARVNDYRDVLADPQVIHNGSVVTVPGSTGTPVSLLAHPVRYDGQVPAIRLPPQALGAQTATILAELGHDQSRIDELFEIGAAAGLR